MTITYKNNVYNFDGKRVKKNGEIMTKFDLAWEYDRVMKYSYMVIYNDVMKYNEIKELFQNALKEKVGI